MRQALTTKPSALMLGALAVAVAGAAAAPAQATYAGKNGPIAFQRFTGGQEDAEIFSMSPSGRVHRLTTGSGASFNPDVSPNGSQLAFERRYGDGRPDAIFTVKSSGGRAAKINSGCTGQCLGDAQPAWSPDGRQILFMRALGPVVHDSAAELDLMVMNRDGSDQRLIRRFGRVVDGRGPGAEGKAEFSPDGRTIALTLGKEGRFGLASSAVYVMNADGSDLRPITPANLHGGNPDWSPNGKLIVFHSNNYNFGARSEIWVVKPNGKGRRRLRRLHLGRDYQPVWSPNGRQIAFGHDAPAVHHGGHVLHPGPNVWTMRSDGSHAHAITNPLDKPNEITPDWGSHR